MASKNMRTSEHAGDSTAPPHPPSDAIEPSNTSAAPGSTSGDVTDAAHDTSSTTADYPDNLPLIAIWHCMALCSWILMDLTNFDLRKSELVDDTKKVDGIKKVVDELLQLLEENVSEELATAVKTVVEKLKTGGHDKDGIATMKHEWKRILMDLSKEKPGTLDACVAWTNKSGNPILKKGLSLMQKYAKFIPEVLAQIQQSLEARYASAPGGIRIMPWLDEDGSELLRDRHMEKRPKHIRRPRCQNE